MPDPLDDIQAYDRLHEALVALGREPGRSIAANTALATARRALFLLQMGLLAASEIRQDDQRPELEPPPQPR
jgi:hypothetical protein